MTILFIHKKNKKIKREEFNENKLQSQYNQPENIIDTRIEEKKQTR